MIETFEKAETIGLSGRLPKLDVGEELELHFFLAGTMDIRHIRVNKRQALGLLSKLASWLDTPNNNW